MIVTTYKCDLCSNSVDHPYGGYFLVFSGCGGISLIWLDDTNERRKTDKIICRLCAKGLQIPKLPKLPDWMEDDNGRDR
jgi:hypothetical protein